ncbi:hypothetical protein B5X24_HaOG205198 [Helicoverpa armigera]|uniref:RRM domain-containing protein n=1 Tax=Helicoverpa armigera TaxID=29058 RepID=A0A2W1BLX8_HELAM|nr:hypothetical protein B5X24_HaOG205198 [Helicoverpa armigera]
MKDRATSHLRIYVGGLQDSATIDELYEHFIQFGQINGIVINRNFGFVQFEEESSAQEAISKANGSIFQGKSLNVKTAQTNLTVEKSRHNDQVAIQQEVPPSVALNDKLPLNADDGNEELYDNFGNYIGDQSKYYVSRLKEKSFSKDCTNVYCERGECCWLKCLYVANYKVK